MHMTEANCETGELTTTPLSDEQRATLEDAAAKNQTEHEARVAQRQSDLDAVIGALPKSVRAAAQRLFS